MMAAIYPAAKIYFKEGVACTGFPPPILFAMQESAIIIVAQGERCTVTSWNDRSHRVGSDHYVNYGFDLRSKLLHPSIKQAVRDQISHRVGPTFYVALEFLDEPEEHFHLGFRPKPATTILVTV